MNAVKTWGERDQSEVNDMVKNMSNGECDREVPPVQGLPVQGSCFTKNQGCTCVNYRELRDALSFSRIRCLREAAFALPRCDERCQLECWGDHQVFDSKCEQGPALMAARGRSVRRLRYAAFEGKWMCTRSGRGKVTASPVARIGTTPIEASATHNPK